MNFRFRRVALLLTLFFPAWLYGQDEKELAPVTRTYAITNVNIIQGPGRKIDMGTVVMKDGLITAIGKGIAIPAEAIVIKADSMFVYAGFIDGLTRAGVNKPKDEIRERVKDPGDPPPDRAGITPQTDVRNLISNSDKSLEELRGLGFTTVQTVPYGNLLPGQAAIILTAASTNDGLVLVSRSALYSELSGAPQIYPSNILGVMATWRTLYRKASQAKTYEGLYASNRNGIERPTGDRILEAFYPVIDQKQPVLFKTERLLDVHRVFTLKNDLNFSLVIADLKDGWPLINKLKSTNTKVFLSLDLPEEVKKDEKKDDKAKKEPAKAKTTAELEKEALEKRKVEAIANYTSQASNFQKAGIPFGFSSMTVKTKDITANLRRMIAAGLSEDAALAALTTSPAQLLGLSDRMGTIENGKMANLVVSDKPYFNEKAKVRYVFVDGVLFKMDVKEVKKSDNNTKVDLEGAWSAVSQTPQGSSETKLVFRKSGSGFAGTASGGRLPEAVELQDVTLDGTSLSFYYSVSFGSNTFKVEVTATIDGTTFKGTATAGQFGSFPIDGTKDPKQ